MRPGSWLDRAEERLARHTRALGGSRAYFLASAGLVLLALLVRLPILARADDVWAGHPDSWVFFHQAYAEYIRGNTFPDAHRGSGWQLLLAGTLKLLGFQAGEGWTPYGTPMEGDAARAAVVAHSLSVGLSIGAVAATLLLARELLSRPAALLAGALVALDPYLLRLSTVSISEPLFIPLFVLATLTTLRARRHPAWVLATGVLMALAHVLKVNGLVLFGMLGIYALFLLRERPFRFLVGAWWRPADRRLLLWGLGALAVFLLVASPYLVWRNSYLPGPFDYGTNQRFWADDLWNLQDEWWTAYTWKDAAPRETAADYFAKHSWRDAALRLWQSIEWQIFDLFGSGRWPALEEEGGVWVGTAPEESALTPLVAGLSFVAAFTVLRRREWWFLPLALAATFLTFLWIYPLVRSVRYFAPLIPFFVLAAVAGWRHVAGLTRRPHVATAGVFGGYMLLYAGVPLLHVPEGLRMLAHPDARLVLGVLTLLWLAVALAPALAERRQAGTRVAASPGDSP